MGKIADRLAQRNDPTRVAARTLVKYAALAAQSQDGDDIDQVQGLMNGFLATLSPEDFEQFQNVFTEEAEARHDAPDVLAALSTTVQVGCEFVDSELETTQLCALPLMVIDSPQRRNLTLSEAQLEAVGSVLRNHYLVETDARLTLSPTLLRLEDASNMMVGQVFRLNRHLAAEDAAGVADLMASVTGAVRRSMGEPAIEDEPPSPAHEGRHLTLGVLIFAVTSDDLEVFPLTAELDAVTDAEDVTQAAEDEAYEDLRLVLGSVGSEFATILGAEEVRVLSEPRGWASGLRSALLAERGVCVQMALRDAANEHANGNEDALCVDTESLRLTETEYGAPAVSVPVLLKKTRAVVSELVWPLLPPETPMEGIDDLSGFLEADGVAQLSDLPAKPDKPSFSVVSNTRH